MIIRRVGRRHTSCKDYSKERTKPTKRSILSLSANAYRSRLKLPALGRSVLGVWLVILIVLSSASITSISTPPLAIASSSPSEEEENEASIYRSARIQDSIDKRLDSTRQDYRLSNDEKIDSKPDEQYVQQEAELLASVQKANTTLSPGYGTNTNTTSTTTTVPVPASETIELKTTVDVQSINKLGENQEVDQINDSAAISQAQDVSQTKQYLTPYSEVEFKALKQRAQSGELPTPGDQVISPPNAKEVINNLSKDRDKENINNNNNLSKDSTDIPFSMPLSDGNNDISLSSPITSQALETGPRPLEQTQKQPSIQHVTSSSGFDGINQDQGGGVIPSDPPDIGMAVGPNHIMEGVNVKFAIYNKVTGAQSALIQPQTFFGVPVTDRVFDPRIMYDVLSDRWFIAMMDMTRRTILIAVSASSDPTGTWRIYEILTMGGIPVCPDYPRLGLSNDKLVLSVNVFGSPSPNACQEPFQGSRIAVMEKSQMLAGAGANTLFFGPIGEGSELLSIQPVQALTTSSKVIMVSTETGEGSGNGIRVFTISGTPSENDLTMTETLLTVGTYSEPPNAAQPGTASLQDTGDTRAQQAVRNKNLVWFPFTTGCVPTGDTMTRSCIKLVGINLLGPFNQPALFRDITIGIANTYLYYPALTTDFSGSTRVIYGASSSTLFPSLFATGQWFNAPSPTLLEPIITIKQGTQANNNIVNGEHFATAIDPTDTTSVWVAGQYHTIPNRWSTFISKISILWADWESLSGLVRPNTDPHVIRNSDGRLEVFIVSTDNRVWHKWQLTINTNSWSNWELLGASVRSGSDVAVAMNADGRLELFVIADDGALWHNWQTTASSSSSWSGWQSLGGQLRSNSDPVVAMNINDMGRLEVFVIAIDNALYHKWQNSPSSSTSWSSYASLGGSIRTNSDVAVARNSADDPFGGTSGVHGDRLNVFIIGADNAVYHKWQNTLGTITNDWSEWHSLGGNIKPNTDPAVIPNSDARLELFVIGADNKLYHKWQTAPITGTDQWSSYSSLGGSIRANDNQEATQPQLMRNSDRRLEVFIIGGDNAIYHKWQNSLGTSATWSDWHGLGGSVRPNTDPTVGLNADTRPEIFMVGGDNSLYHKWRTN
jgi:hypothetical protein